MIRARMGSGIHGDPPAVTLEVDSTVTMATLKPEAVCAMAIPSSPKLVSSLPGLCRLGLDARRLRPDACARGRLTVEDTLLTARDIFAPAIVHRCSSMTYGEPNRPRDG
jgi:hypothetical protein